jgi:hypothetical protein
MIVIRSGVHAEPSTARTTPRTTRNDLRRRIGIPPFWPESSGEMARVGCGDPPVVPMVLSFDIWQYYCHNSSGPLFRIRRR